MTGEPISEAALREQHTEFERPRVAELEAALDQVARRERQVDLEMPCRENTLSVGLISDTHYGSLYEAREQTTAFYRLCAREGVEVVLHAGDVLDGHRIYKGQEYEIHKQGFDAQLEWFAEQAPDDVRTVFIAGNHDASFKKAAGIAVGKAITQARPDWTWLGDDYGRIDLFTANGRRWRVLLVHPDGGTPYAISYRAQGIIRDLEGGSKPQMVGIGHLHKAMLMPAVRNICTFQAGCFQWQTPFMVRKPTDAHVGGWILRITPGEDAALSNQVEARFVAFYREALC